MAEEKPIFEQPGEPTPAPKTPPKSDTSRIDLADAEVPKPGAPTSEPLTIKEALRSGEAPPKAIPVPPTTVVKAVPAGGPKTSTSRISLDAAKTETSALGAAKDSTVRVDLTGIYEREGISPPGGARPGAPARIRVEETPEVPSSDETSHIRLDESGQATADETSHIVLPGGPPPPPPPKTVRLQRPSTLPKTVVLPKPGAAAPAAPPKTVVLKRPDEEAEATKGTTSRITIPEGAAEPGPTTQRKTIRIKRPGAGAPTGGKTLVIARPSKPAPMTLPASAREQAEEIAREMEPDEGPGVLFALLTLAAVLVAAVLVYVLAAQTVAPSLPFPGRLM
jgi:hypothetical protein